MSYTIVDGTGKALYRFDTKAKAMRAVRSMRAQLRSEGRTGLYNRLSVKKNPRRKSTARRKSSAKRKRAPNAKFLVFKTKRAATAYAKSHGIPKSRYSLKRMKKAR